MYTHSLFAFYDALVLKRLVDDYYNCVVRVSYDARGNMILTIAESFDFGVTKGCLISDRSRFIRGQWYAVHCKMALKTLQFEVRRRRIHRQQFV
jgi:hypothetical protein